MSWRHAPVEPKTPLEVAQKAHHDAIRRDSDVNLGRGELVRLYSKMLEIRLFEEEVAVRARRGEGLAIHQYTGQEAVAVGVCSLLSREDKIVSNHRPFGHFIAKGGDIRALMAELYGRKKGVTMGIGGEMNLSDPSIGFMMSTMFVGANITISTGLALSQKLTKSSGLTVCFFGEGATTNGAFHEGMTLAALLRLPILYVCENNGYSTNTPSREFMPSDLVVQRASGYGFPTTVVDGSDLVSVIRASSEAMQQVRSGGGPRFIEAIVGRIGPHKQELVDTRTPEEKRDASFRDPVLRLETLLKSKGYLTDAADTKLKVRTKAGVLEAVRFARIGAKLSLAEVANLIYADKFGKALLEH